MQPQVVECMPTIVKFRVEGVKFTRKSSNSGESRQIPKKIVKTHDSSFRL